MGLTHLWTIPKRDPAGIDPSSLKYVTVGMCTLRCMEKSSRRGRRREEEEEEEEEEKKGGGGGGRRRREEEEEEEEDMTKMQRMGGEGCFIRSH